MRTPSLFDTLRGGYGAAGLKSDLLAGLSVGIVALPLAMALAIASGVPPQYGLYTTIVAGIVAALAGGSRFNITGPTAAFVVVLLPITQDYGLGGLLVATVLSGLILLALGVVRLGRLIGMVPYPVTVGFTAGIGAVIAMLQVKDFLGLTTEPLTGHFLEKAATLIAALPSLNLPDFTVGAVTLATMLLGPRFHARVPAHLAAIVVGTLAALAIAALVPGANVATIGSEFHFRVGDLVGAGIPPLPPSFGWPWEFPGADGEPIGLSFELVRQLIGPAFAIAMLGAIESLLCAVVADGMTGTRHRPNAELIGQGLGNVVAPFFGGIPATAAIARTATNIRAGAVSPVAAIVHALVVLVAVVALAGLLGHIPMAALSALLLVVAWNMSEPGHVVHLLRIAPAADRAVLITCFSLTVLFDMVIAVAVGIGLAGVLFIRRITDLTESHLLEPGSHEQARDLPPSVALYDINGPLFFGATEKALHVLRNVRKEVRVVILDFTDVPMMDVTAIVALDSTVRNLRRHGTALVFTNLNDRLIDKLARAGIREEPGLLEFARGIGESRERALALAGAAEDDARGEGR